MPFGYGPAAKLLVLATVLGGCGLRLVFTGRGIALELASRTRHLFDEIVPAGPDGPPDAIARSAAGVLSVMDREIAQAAREAAVPLYVVDSLLWMRESIPPAFREASRYWAQDFVGLRDRLADYQPVPSVVGPIIDPLRRHETGRDRLLINLGGCESPDGPGAGVGAYTAFIVAGLRASSLFRQFAGRTTLMAGARCVEALRATNGDGAIELVSVSHERALERLADASLVLTAPGLTMTLESFQAGAPTYFLPPQNYSQWCALRLLRAVGLAPHALHWEDLADVPRLGDRMPESERNPLVRAAIARFTVDDDARARFGRGLQEIARTNHNVLAEAQTRFLESLGPNGALTIADEIADHVLSAEVGQTSRGRGTH
jgi:hypothetical protein